MKCEWCLHSEGGHWPDCPEPRFDAVCSERDELRSQNVALRERNAELEASYRDKQPCGHPKNFLVGELYPPTPRAAIPENAPNALASSEVERDVKSPVSGADQ